MYTLLKLMSPPTLLFYKFYSRLYSTIGRKIINKLCRFNVIQNYIESLSLNFSKMVMRFNGDARSFPISRLSFSCNPPPPRRNEQDRRPQAGTLDAGGACRNTLPPKDFLRGSVAFGFGKWQSLFLLTAMLHRSIHRLK